jgi:hypothetical protein
MNCSGLENRGFVSSVAPAVTFLRLKGYIKENNFCGESVASE